MFIFTSFNYIKD